MVEKEVQQLATFAIKKGTNNRWIKGLLWVSLGHGL